MRTFVVATTLIFAIAVCHAQTSPPSRPRFHLYICPGLDLSSLNFTYKAYPETISFDKQIELRLGVEAEWILSRRSDKWSLVVQPAYISYTPSNHPEGGFVHYRALQLLAGLRYYFVANQPSVWYLTGSAFDDLPSDTRIIAGNWELNGRPRIDPAISAGYRFKDRFGAELKYEVPGQVVDFVRWESAPMKTASLILSYKIL
jgi:hypothetical protein